MLIDYIGSFQDIERLCNQFEERVSQVYFASGKVGVPANTSYCETKYYLEIFHPIKACADLCRTMKPSTLNDPTALYDSLASLGNYSDVNDWKMFSLNLNLVKSILGGVSEEMVNMFSSLDEQEKGRINKAIHNHFEDCHYSCVAMSVSAAESRLLKLMCIVNPQSEQELETKTLGQLISDYVSNRESYKKVVPEKHEPLLQLCNTYRIFSVHPKKEEIPGMVAVSILGLAIAFLTDPENRPEAVKRKITAGT